MGSTIHYLLRQIDIMINRRIMSINEKKPGALFNDIPDKEFPQIIWVRMLKRPMIESTHLILNSFHLRGKFNSILEESLQDGKCDCHKIMNVEVELSDFDNLGNLLSAGQTHFWKEIDKALKKFDASDIKLRP